MIYLLRVEIKYTLYNISIYLQAEEMFGSLSIIQVLEH